jgi:Icc-related predicted phosphoesterase
VLISVVADVHGNYDGLARAAEAADLLLVLGDLLDYVDYHDPAGGILGAVFGEDLVRPFVRMRTQGDFAGLHRYNIELWSRIADPAQAIHDIVVDRYATVVELLPDNALVMLGNVDVAAAWAEVAPPHLQALDSETRIIDGAVLGFVGGGSTRPGAVVRANASPWKPFVRSAADYQAALATLPAVDVLCTHIPPKLTTLRYDTVPARLEMYGPGLLEYIDTHQPRYALSGHVHQPIGARLRRGRTECVNVGHFQRSARPYLLAL